MKLCSLKVDAREVFVSDLNSRVIFGFVESGSNEEPLFGRGVADQLYDRLKTDERTSTPVLRNERKHAVLDLVPFAGAGRTQAMNAEWPTARFQMDDQPRPPGNRKRMDAK